MKLLRLEFYKCRRRRLLPRERSLKHYNLRRSNRLSLDFGWFGNRPGVAMLWILSFKEAVPYECKSLFLLLAHLSRGFLEFAFQAVQFPYELAESVLGNLLPAVCLPFEIQALLT